MLLLLLVLTLIGLLEFGVRSLPRQPWNPTLPGVSAATPRLQPRHAFGDSVWGGTSTHRRATTTIANVGTGAASARRPRHSQCSTTAPYVWYFSDGTAQPPSQHTKPRATQHPSESRGTTGSSFEAPVPSGVLLTTVTTYVTLSATSSDAAHKTSYAGTDRCAVTSSRCSSSCTLSFRSPTQVAPSQSVCSSDGGSASATSPPRLSGSTTRARPHSTFMSDGVRMMVITYPTTLSGLTHTETTTLPVPLRNNNLRPITTPIGTRMTLYSYHQVYGSNTYTKVHTLMESDFFNLNIWSFELRRRALQARGLAQRELSPTRAHSATAASVTLANAASGLGASAVMPGATSPFMQTSNLLPVSSDPSSSSSLTIGFSSLITARDFASAAEAHPPSSASTGQPANDGRRSAANSATTSRPVGAAGASGIPTAYRPAMTSALVAHATGGVFGATDPNRPNRGLRPLTGWHYAFATYAPIAIAVALRAVVGYVYASAKLMQPFAALAPYPASAAAEGRAGVPAAAFFHVGYLSAISAFDPIVALFSSCSRRAGGGGGRPTMLVAAAALYLAVGLCVPLASELLSLAPYCYVHTTNTAGDGGGGGGRNSGKRHMRCGPEIRMNYDVGRILQALLALTATILLALLSVAVHRRVAAMRAAAAAATSSYKNNSNKDSSDGRDGGSRCSRCGGSGGSCGLYQDPSAIATLASLLHHPAVLADFRRVDPDATKEELLAALAHRRYALGWYESTAGGCERYGVIPATPDAPPTASSTNDTQDDEGASNAADDSEGNNTNNYWQRLRLKARRRRHLRHAAGDALLAAVTAAILAIIVVYYTNDSPRNKLEDFLNSQQFGPRFMMTVVGVYIFGQWKHIERGKKSTFQTFSS